MNDRFRRLIGIVAATTVAILAITVPTSAGPSGARMVEDIRPGPAGSNPQELTASAGYIYFSANDGVHGRELWRSDTDPEGTIRLKDIRSGGAGSMPWRMTDVAGRLFFTANDGVHGRQLWTTDGLRSGTRRLTDFQPYAESFPDHLTAVGDQLFFSAYGPTGRNELWKSDGSPGGTVRVKRFAAGQSIQLEPASFNGSLYFLVVFGTLASHGLGLWTSDGTPAGTHHFFGQVGSFPERITRSGARLYYVRRQDLMRTIGTVAGTRSLGKVTPYWLTDVNGTLFFNGYTNNGDSADEGLWRSDGTKATTVLVKALSNPTDLTYVWPDKVFFQNRLRGDPTELWVSDGSEAGTELMVSFATGTELTDLTQAVGMLFFCADGVLWRSDGTAGGTESVADLGGIERVTNVQGILNFSADDGINGRELWFMRG